MKQNLRPCALVLLFAAIAPQLHAQKRSFTQAAFLPAKTSAVPFTSFKKTDFAPAAAPDDGMITLPNKKKVKLSDYITAINRVEGNLSNIGFARNRVEKTILASRLKATAPLPAGAPAQRVTIMSTNSTRPKNTALNARFVKQLPQLQRAKELKANLIFAANADRINALPNEKFNRSHDLTPPVFKAGDYGVQIVANYYLKGENDPFVFTADDMNDAGVKKLMKETNSFYTAGMNLTAASTLPELGGLTAYKLDCEFTARSNKAQKHSLRARLQIMQQVLLDERRDVSGDEFNFTSNQVYQASKLIGAADIFTYGINAVMPVDFYLASVGVGADIDVDLKRTGINGTMGPRASQSIVMETSATEIAPIVGEELSKTVDIGVAGELRLIEGGVDYGFSAGLAANNKRLVFVNDMFAEADLKLLRGRLYTFYQYPVYKCKDIYGVLDLSCWETRRVENDLFNTGAALELRKKVVDEDLSEYVRW